MVIAIPHHIYLFHQKCIWLPLILFTVGVQTSHAFQPVGNIWRDSIIQTLHKSEQLAREDPHRALTLAFHALELNEKLMPPHDTSEYQTNCILANNLIAHIYQQSGQYHKALAHYEKSLEIARMINHSDLYRIYENMAFINEQLEKYDEAYSQILAHTMLKDSLFNIEKKQAVEELRSLYSAREKQAKIDSLEMEKQYISMKNEEEATFYNVIIIAAAVLLFPILVLLLVYIQKLKSERQLTYLKTKANKRRVAEQERVMEMKAIKAGIEAQEKEKGRIASELHDNVAGTLAGIKHSLAKMIKNNNLQSLNKVIHNIDATYQEIRTLSHHLAPPAALAIDFILFLKKYLGEISEINNLNMTISVYPESDFNGLTHEMQTEIYRITQECINNIVKHANANHVDISFTSHEGSISLMIEDDGVGFNPAIDCDGSGLENIRHRIGLMEGELDIDSVVSRGTVVSVVFPVRNSPQDLNQKILKNK